MKANTAFGFKPIGFTMKSAFADRGGEFKRCLGLIFGFFLIVQERSMKAHQTEPTNQFRFLYFRESS
jgi:hypothetical protein